MCQRGTGDEVFTMAVSGCRLDDRRGSHRLADCFPSGKRTIENQLASFFFEKKKRKGETKSGRKGLVFDI